MKHEAPLSEIVNDRLPVPGDVVFTEPRLASPFLVLVVIPPGEKYRGNMFVEEQVLVMSKRGSLICVNRAALARLCNTKISAKEISR